jgi:hypothetical protein
MSLALVVINIFLLFSCENNRVNQRKISDILIYNKNSKYANYMRFDV